MRVKDDSTVQLANFNALREKRTVAVENVLNLSPEEKARRAKERGEISSAVSTIRKTLDDTVTSRRDALQQELQQLFEQVAQLTKLGDAKSQAAAAAQLAKRIAKVARDLAEAERSLPAEQRSFSAPVAAPRAAGVPPASGASPAAGAKTEPAAVGQAAADASGALAAPVANGTATGEEALKKATDTKVADKSVGDKKTNDTRIAEAKAKEEKAEAAKVTAATTFAIKNGLARSSDFEPKVAKAIATPTQAGAVAAPEAAKVEAGSNKADLSKANFVASEGKETGEVGATETEDEAAKAFAKAAQEERDRKARYTSGRGKTAELLKQAGDVLQELGKVIVKVSATADVLDPEGAEERKKTVKEVRRDASEVASLAGSIPPVSVSIQA